MNINGMTDEQLAEKLKSLYFTGQRLPQEWAPFLAMAKFLRQLVKDSMPTDKAIQDLINLYDGKSSYGINWCNTENRERIPNTLGKCDYCGGIVRLRSLAEAIRKLMEASS